MSRTGLVLAAHGSRHEPAVNRAVEAMAQSCESALPFDEVRTAFHQGSPGFHEVLDLMTAQEIIVVPVMTSGGYFATERLPRDLEKNKRHSDLQLVITRPLGTHPSIARMIIDRLVDLRATYELDTRPLTVAIIGHGTPRHAASRQATIELTQQVRNLLHRLPFVEGGHGAARMEHVVCAFIDDEPPVASVLEDAGRRDVLVVPFMMNAGPHALSDIPGPLGLPAVDGLPSVASDGRRRILIDRPVGEYPEIVHVVSQVAQMAVHGGGRQRVLRVGTRASPMARTQAARVAEELQRLGFETSIELFETSGDRDRNTPMTAFLSDSPFADEIEQAMLHEKIDLAVHSYKDLSLHPQAGLEIAAVLARDDPREALVAANPTSLSQLPAGARIGTSSERRRAQLLAIRPDLRPIVIRGPVDQRVKAVQAGDYDAAILAVAGLNRLDLQGHAVEIFDSEVFMPAPAQGALVVQTRADDPDARRAAALLDETRTRLVTTAELHLARLVPHTDDWVLAAHARMEQTHVNLASRLLSANGLVAIDADCRAESPVDAASGAWEILKEKIESIEIKELPR